MYHEEIIILGLSEIQKINYVFLGAMSFSVNTLLTGKCFGIKHFLFVVSLGREVFSHLLVCVFLFKVSVLSALVPTEECFKFPISAYLKYSIGI